jgi:site-specific DNA recombinase
MRYAAYVRVSDEEQLRGYSLDAQRRIIQDWGRSKGGSLVKVYSEEGESATTADRTQFQQLRLDARRGAFDAVVVHKFDRFARNRYDALAIKSLFRYDYKIKVLSVTEPSEDSGDGPIGALIEGIMECVADWYSRNLATEVKKARNNALSRDYTTTAHRSGWIRMKISNLSPTSMNSLDYLWHLMPLQQGVIATQM